MASLWIRSSRRRSFLGFAMALQRTAARAEGVAGCGRSATVPLRPGRGWSAKVLPLLHPHHLFPAPRSQELRLVQVVEIFANLPPVASRPPGVTHEIAESVGSPG